MVSRQSDLGQQSQHDGEQPSLIAFDGAIPVHARSVEQKMKQVN
jgi:hypothetical protein